MSPLNRPSPFSTTVVRRKRCLPLPGEVLVSEGQVVEPGTVIARTEVVPGDPYVIDLRAEFKRSQFSPDELGELMLKTMGDRVSRGEPIARLRRGIFGGQLEAVSPVDGVVEFVSLASGRILVREQAQSANPVVVVNVARDLDIWPAMLRMYMRYREGDQVQQGSILAASPGATRMDYSYAPASGTIQRIDPHTGAVYIVRPSKTTRVTAYLAGTIEEIIPQMGAVVSTRGLVVYGVFGIGGEAYGELAVTCQASGARLDHAMRGKVLAVHGRVGPAFLDKAVEAGVTALILGGVDQGALVRLTGHEMGSGITGDEEIPLTIVLTEGFGQVAMADDVFALLAQHEGKVISLNGRTQVRAGAVRPEAVIPLDDAEDGPAEACETGSRGEIALGIGQRVRVVSSPYFGMLGEVESLPPEPERLETGAVLPVAVVCLADGTRVPVAQDNLEVF